MRLHRVKAILIHTQYHLRHSVETWTDIFWFPVINTVVISGLALYIGKSQGMVSGEILIAGLVMWFAFEPASYSIAVSALWEVWSRSFSSLFITPLTISEFIAGQMLFSLVKEFLLITVVSTISYLILGFSIFSLGPIVVLYLFLLTMFGWAFGCFILGLVLRFGTRIQSLAWGLAYAVQPFIGMYYPVEIFPPVFRIISTLLPPTYVYKAMRENIAGNPPGDLLYIAFVLNIVYFIAGFLFMKMMWERARRSGSLARMEE